MTQQLELSIDESKVVAKANRLVQGRHDLTTTEQRVFVAMVAKLDRSMDEFSMQELSIKRVCDLSGIDASNLYRKVDEVTDNLVEKTISVRHQDKEGQEVGFEKYPIFSVCKYKRGSGVIQARFNDEMRPLLLDLKRRFTLYLVTIFLRLRSTYSMQIYEMLKMRQDLHRHCLSLTELRQKLSIENKYKHFYDLKRRVLEQARTELKEKADIYFTYRVKRENNSPKEVEFLIHENEEVIAEMEAEHGLVGTEERRPRSPDTSESDSDERPTNEETIIQDAPRSADARVMFLERRTQAELQDLDQEHVDELYQTARGQVERSEGTSLPDALLEGLTGRRMEKLWEEAS
ncbi:MAG: replication initiation protein [Salinibacter sp.]